MSNSSNFNVTLTLDSNAYNAPQIRINGHPLELLPEEFLTMGTVHRSRAFIIRTDRRPTNRHPVPYPIHVNVRSNQQREAERRRAAMTPSTSGTSYVPQAREVRLASICAIRPTEVVRPNPDDITEVRDAVPDDFGDTCVICLSQYEAEDKVRILLCNHKFHKKCIDKWFSVLLNCPICRMGIDGNPREEEEDDHAIALSPESNEENDEDDSANPVMNNPSAITRNIIIID